LDGDGRTKAGGDPMPRVRTAFPETAFSVRASF
jgi:hypothetical protein